MAGRSGRLELAAACGVAVCLHAMRWPGSFPTQRCTFGLRPCVLLLPQPTAAAQACCRRDWTTGGHKAFCRARQEQAAAAAPDEPRGAAAPPA
jgi:hypothetical protein